MASHDARAACQVEIQIIGNQRVQDVPWASFARAKISRADVKVVVGLESRRPRTALATKSVGLNVQARLHEIAAATRGFRTGANGCPEWGTQFNRIDADGMSVGLELARVLMEQSVDEHTHQLPKTSMPVEDNEVTESDVESRTIDHCDHVVG